jgi:2-methylisocitrate lyase-like PEP mutase family enzyme
VSQSERAALFRELHKPGQFLILPNAWDAGSARLIESCGAPAMATSSAAVAWAHGYPDGNAIPPAVLTRGIELIARVIRVPLSVDSEEGYASDPAKVGEHMFDFASAGAVGINLEDGTADPDVLRAKIDAAKRGARRAGVDLFVNARIDVILRQLVPRQKAVEEIVARARRYADAGCDGIFVPKLADENDIRSVVAAIDPLPLNVMAVPGLPAAAHLQRLGVRRLSAGAAVARAANSVIKQLATRFLSEGRSDDLFSEVKEPIDMNALLKQS